MYQTFYDDHIVMGYYEVDSGSSAPSVDPVAIDRKGNYRVLCDGDAEELGTMNLAPM